mmetsp:Transcript_58321/g.136362  ORF Transcript_58321/g.136362 Transcript_58321/m.136362 type:complete len:200 (+) Transcript_58321:263-862(+)
MRMMQATKASACGPLKLFEDKDSVKLLPFPTMLAHWRSTTTTQAIASGNLSMYKFRVGLRNTACPTTQSMVVSKALLICFRNCTSSGTSSPSSSSYSMLPSCEVLSCLASCSLSIASSSLDLRGPGSDFERLTTPDVIEPPARATVKSCAEADILILAAETSGFELEARPENFSNLSAASSLLQISRGSPRRPPNAWTQ